MQHVLNILTKKSVIQEYLVSSYPVEYYITLLWTWFGFPFIQISVVFPKIVLFAIFGSF